MKAANRYGVTPLSLACTNGNAAMVELLLKAGADPNTTLPGGETALMTAARTGKVGGREALLAHGADVNAKEAKRGQTAHHVGGGRRPRRSRRGADRGRRRLSRALDSGFTPFLFAVREGQIGVVRALLKAGADVNETIRTRSTRSGPASGAGVPRPGTSALHLAVGNAHFELAAFLLDAGADPNAIGPGYTPLHIDHVGPQSRAAATTIRRRRARAR